MKLVEAQEIVDDLLTGNGEIASNFAEWTVCGSIRRKKEEVHDIDIVAVEKTNYAFGEQSLAEKVNRLDPEGAKAAKEMGKSAAKRFHNGPAIKRFMYRGAMIDLYLATPDTYECLKLIRTGSADHNVRLATLAKGKGMRLYANGDGLWNVTYDLKGEPVKISKVSGTEEGILTTLLGRFPEPEKRNDR